MTEMSDAEAAIRVLIAQNDRTPWFWKLQWHWFGWKTLVPFSYGHDEYARRTLVVGWTITGRVIFPLWDCGDEACHYWAIEEMKKEGNDD